MLGSFCVLAVVILFLVAAISFPLPPDRVAYIVNAGIALSVALATCFKAVINKWEQIELQGEIESEKKRILASKEDLLNGLGTVMKSVAVQNQIPSIRADAQVYPEHKEGRTDSEIERLGLMSTLA